MNELKPNFSLQNGKYKIIESLGQGSFGITYLAMHTALDHKVAIKEFFMKDLNSRGEDGSITGISDGSLSYNYGQKFRKEAHNLASLEHPHIVRVIDSFEENCTFYYVMDYIEGQNLNDFLKQNSLSEKEAVSIITDVADALIYMHNQKHMLHLDLKPGNIMRRASDGNIFLIDFGLSKHFSDSGQPETSTTIGLGTPGYAPIEQSNQAKNGEFRPTIDVYALGATLFKLLTRETPPPVSDIVCDDDLIERKLREYGISPNLVNTICKAMLPNVRKRTQSVADFVASINSISHPGDDESTQFEDKSNISDNNEETRIGNSHNASNHKANINLKKSTFDLDSYSINPDFLSNPKEVEANANNGYKESMFVLAIMYLRGEGKFQNIDKAHGWLVRCRENGDERALELLKEWESLSAKLKGEKATSTTNISLSKGKNTAGQSKKNKNIDLSKGSNNNVNLSKETNNTPTSKGTNSILEANQSSSKQKKDTDNTGKSNKKIIIGAIAGLVCLVILAVVLFSGGSSQYGSEPQTEEDSLTYYLGLAQGGSLKQYAQMQLGVDSIYFDDFLEGLNEGATGLQGSVPSDEMERDAYIKGIEVGKQVIKMNQGLASEAFGDSTRTDGLGSLLYGLVESFTGKSKISSEEAMSTFQNKLEKIKAKYSQTANAGAIESKDNSEGASNDEQSNEKLSDDNDESTYDEDEDEPQIKEYINNDVSEASNSQTVSNSSYDDSDDEGEIFEVVEQQPTFPGGIEKLMDWLSKNLKYPASAQENGTQGRVICTFVVNKDGRVVEPRVIKSVDPALDKEALRVINAMPKWIPGKQRGKTVRVRYTLPVTFRLQ